MKQTFDLDTMLFKLLKDHRKSFRKYPAMFILLAKGPTIHRKKTLLSIQ